MIPCDRVNEQHDDCVTNSSVHCCHLNHEEKSTDAECNSSQLNPCEPCFTNPPSIKRMIISKRTPPPHNHPTSTPSAHHIEVVHISSDSGFELTFLFSFLQSKEKRKQTQRIQAEHSSIKPQK